MRFRRILRICLSRGGAIPAQSRFSMNDHRLIQGTSHMDIILIGIGALFFALTFAYTKACDTL